MRTAYKRSSNLRAISSNGTVQPTGPEPWEANVWLVSNPEILRQRQGNNSRPGMKVALFVNTTRTEPDEAPVICEGITGIFYRKSRMKEFLQKNPGTVLVKEGKRCAVLIQANGCVHTGREEMSWANATPDLMVEF